MRVGKCKCGGEIIKELGCSTWHYTCLSCSMTLLTPGVDQMHKVYGFFNDFRWLSNFHLSAVTLDGEIYPSVEHAYQAAKTNDPEVRKQIREAQTPKVAKRLGTQLVKMTENDRRYWNNKKYWIMMGLIRQKFHNSKELQEKLVATGNAELVEANWWGDTYWGVCNDQGENNLGKILMKTREEFVNAVKNT